jgi:hypothetical protein
MRPSRHLPLAGFVAAAVAVQLLAVQAGMP